MRLAKIDFKKSLELARRVSESWFRCQALAGAARFAPDDRVVPTTKEAIAAALTTSEPYQRVAATAWPLRALIERGQEQAALRLLPEILAGAARIENPVSRSDALFLLWEAFFPVAAHQSVLGLLLISCKGHGKAERILAQVALILASQNPQEAQRIAAGMPDGRLKRQAEERLAEGRKQEAKQFFF